MIDGFDDCLEDRKSDMIVTDTAVTDPRRVGDGIKAFTTFSVTATRALPREPSTTATVTRRFSDFYWLHQCLARSYPGYIVPPLPHKKLMLKFSNSSIEKRRLGLATFLTRVSEHHVLSQSPDFIAFITLSEESMEVKRTATSTRDEVSKWFGGAFKSAVAIVSSSLKGTIDYKLTEDDISCEELSKANQEYLLFLMELKKSAFNLRDANKVVSRSWFHLGQSLTKLPMAYETEIGQTCRSSARAADRMAVLLSKSHQGDGKAEREYVEFEAPLLDLIRLTEAAQGMLDARADILHKYIDALTGEKACKSDLDALKNKNKMDKVSGAQKELLQASRLVEERSIVLARLTKSCMSEMVRFRLEALEMLETLLSSFMSLQVAYSGRAQSVWSDGMNADISLPAPHQEFVQSESDDDLDDL